MKRVQLAIVRLGEALAGGFTTHHIASLKPAQEQDGDHEDDGDEGHEDTCGAAIFVPRVVLAVFVVRVHIIVELELEVEDRDNDD